MTKARDIASAAPAPSTVSATELGYLDGVSSAIQTQIDGKSGTAHNHDSAYLNQSVIDAKGDLLVGSADNAYARLAAGSNGETLVADSSASTGLRWQSNFAAGKNKIINGDFNIWQRGTSLTVNSGDSVYLADRWRVESGLGTAVCSRQTFTVGQTDVPNNPAYFLRMAFSISGGAGTQVLSQWIENVSTFAGQTVTLSFYAKISTGTQSLEAQYVQRFGTGGSSAVAAAFGTMNLTTSWQKFTYTLTIPSISGATVGTNNALQIRFIGNPAAISYDFANVQLESGNTATAFQTATGTLAGELAACQRYFQIISGNVAGVIGAAPAFSSSSAYAIVSTKQQMRTNPTLYQVTGTDYFVIVGNGTTDNFNSFSDIGDVSPQGLILNITSGISVVQGYSYWVRTANASAVVGLQAEL